MRSRDASRWCAASGRTGGMVHRVVFATWPGFGRQGALSTVSTGACVRLGRGGVEVPAVGGKGRLTGARAS